MGNDPELCHWRAYADDLLYVHREFLFNNSLRKTAVRQDANRFEQRAGRIATADWMSKLETEWFGPLFSPVLLSSHNWQENTQLIG